jgi:hypothetical protein
LKGKGLKIWYDSDLVLYSNVVLDRINDGIHRSVLYVVILTENFFVSNWTSYELAAKLQGTDALNVMPILFGIDTGYVASRYPFLLEYKYLQRFNDIEQVAATILETLSILKEQQGYCDMKQTDLNELAKRLHQYNNIKLDRIAIKLRNINRELTSDTLMALNIACLILELILSDIAMNENIYIDDHDNLLKIVEKSGVVTKNVIEHMSFIFQLRRKLINDYSSRLDCDEIYLIEMSMHSIIEYYLLSYFKMPIIRQVSLQIVPPEEMTDEDIDETYNIEALVLPTHLIASPTMTKTWYNYNPLTLLGVRDISTRKLIGFINTLPISDDLYNKIVQGNFDDTIIDTCDIRQYDMPGPYKLYISSLCVHPKYNSTTAFMLIYSSFIDLLLTLATEREVFITDIVADGATVKGATLCETIGMKKCADSIHNTNVYSAALIPPNFATIKLKNRQGQLLIKYYDRVYSDYKELF